MSTVEMPQTAVRYRIDGKRSRFTARAFATGLLSAFAHSPTISIPDVEGEIVWNADAIETGTLRMVIHSAALAVTGDISAKDSEEINRRMRGEVLEADSYPEIVYECSSLSASKTGEGQYQVTLNGELTLHGVNREQPVSARVFVNGATLRAAGDVSILQSDYDIQPVTAAGGTIKLKDEVKLSFDITADIAARKQE